MPDEALRAYPGLRGANGRTVVAGIRSQFLHPAAERPDLPTLTGRIELVEALGSDSMVYLHVDANAVREGKHADQDVVAEAGRSRWRPAQPRRGLPVARATAADRRSRSPWTREAPLLRRRLR